MPVIFGVKVFHSSVMKIQTIKVEKLVVLEERISHTNVVAIHIECVTITIPVYSYSL